MLVQVFHIAVFNSDDEVRVKQVKLSRKQHKLDKHNNDNEVRMPIVITMMIIITITVIAVVIIAIIIIITVM